MEIAMTDLQWLWDHRVRFTIESRGSYFIMKIGDYLTGTHTVGTAPTFDEAVAWVSRQASPVDRIEGPLTA
jgi:hypothetical protein